MTSAEQLGKIKWERLGTATEKVLLGIGTQMAQWVAIFYISTHYFWKLGTVATCT